MKKIIFGVFLIQITLILVWGLIWQQGRSSGTVYIDSQTGITVNQNTPDSTVISFYELLSAKRYEPAIMLLTEPSRDLYTPDFLEEQTLRTRTENAELIKVFPPKISRDLALVSYIRIVYFEQPTAIVGLSALKFDQKKWEIIRDEITITEDRLPEVINLALDLARTMRNDPLERLTSEQREQVSRQVIALLQSFEDAKEQLKP